MAVNPAVSETFLQVLRMEPYLLSVAQSLEETYTNYKTCPSPYTQCTTIHRTLHALPHLRVQSSCCGHSPTINVFASYLRFVYKRQKFPTYDKLPRCPTIKYTHLSSVVKKLVSKQQVDAFTRAILRGDIGGITKKKGAIGIDEIVVVKRGVFPKFILVEGAPGIGKSTFAWRMCRKWAKGKLLREYKLVVLLSFRKDVVRQATCLADIFRVYGRQVHKQAVKEVEDADGKALLLIFEGFDELPIQLRSQNSFFLDVIQGKRVPLATVLVTSRPSASAYLYHECKEYLSQHIEILGFTSENVQSYLETTCGSDPSLLNGIQRYLDCYPHIRTMMYVPLNAAIVVEVYRTSKKNQSYIPKTMTQLYDCLIRSLLRQYLHSHPRYGKEQEKWNVPTLDHLPEDVYKQLYQMGRIAYEGIENGQEVIFDDLPDDFATLGLMQCVPELYVDEGAALSHSFLHLTMQEFMAAFYLAFDPAREFIQHFNSEDPNKKMVLRFLAGLSGLRGVTVGQSMLDKVGVSLSCAHWMFEAQDVCSIVIASMVSFSCALSTARMTIFDCYVLGYCIAHSNSAWRVDLTWCDIGDEALEGMVQGALEKPCQCCGAVSKLKLRLNNITSKGVQHLLKLPTRMLSSTLRALDLDNNPIGNGGAASLIRTLVSLRYLSLTTTGIGVKDCQALCELLRSSSCIETLYCGDNNLPAEAVEMIMSGLQQNTSLKVLRIGKSKFSLGSCKLLASALETGGRLSMLDIFHCSIGPEGAECLAAALANNSTLQELKMPRNPIGIIGAAALAMSIRTHTSLERLNVAYCNINRQGSEYFADALSENSLLQELDMSHNVIEVEGATALSAALDGNRTLRKLHLRDESVRAEGIRQLLNCISQSSSLEQLVLSKGLKKVIAGDTCNSLEDTDRVMWL